MKKKFWALLLVISVGLLSFGSAQTNQSTLFDAKKSQQELQIMKGILSTTLGFVASELRNREAGSSKADGNHLERVYEGAWGGHGIGAYYLYGQGATFVIPISSLRLSFSRSMRGVARLEDLDHMDFDVEPVAAAGGFAEAEAALEAASLAMEEEREDMSDLAAQVAEQAAAVAQYHVQAAAGTAERAVPGTGQVVTPPPPPAPPAPPAVAKAPKPPKPPANAEEVRKRLFEAQEKVKQRREEMEARRQKLLQSLSEVKVFLIEALANHGDSLTTVKPNEYINIIFTTDEGFPMYSEGSSSRSVRQVVTVQKSWITDYKAGRLTMEAFRQKALQYNT
jgi:hypothetical protein